MTSVQRSFSNLYPDIQLLTFNPLFAQLVRPKRLWASVFRWEWNLNPGQASCARCRSILWASDSIQTHGFHGFTTKHLGRLPEWLNRSLGEGLNLRMSYGESLRFASIAEKYVEGTLTDGSALRNIDLVSESGNNWKVGLVRELKSVRACCSKHLPFCWSTTK